MTEYYLIYDDTCQLCLKAIRKVTRLDALRIVHLVPLSHPKLPRPLKLPPKEELEQEIHLLDSEGKIWKGADAMAKLAKLFPKTRVVGKVMELPGIRHASRPMYRMVAKTRRRG